MNTSNKKAWHHTPQLPIESAPMWDWPQPVSKLVLFFFGRGFLFSQRTLYAFVALFAWVYLMPGLDQVQHASGLLEHLLWIGQVAAVVWLINLCFGWGYHFLFYTSNLNAKDCKFDARPLATNSPRFLFSNQLWDNVFLSLSSGVLVAVLYMCFFLWLYAFNYIPAYTWQDGWLLYMAAFPIVVWWSSLHFYLVHRLMHEWKWLYNKVHALHHKNINIGPWSGMAMHPVEHVLYLSSVVIHLVLPSDPILVLFHLIYLAAGAYLGHIGHEGFYIGKHKVLAGGNFYHQLHHRYFDCNYSSPEMPWDKWFGSFHNGTEEATAKIRQKNRST